MSSRTMEGEKNNETRENDIQDSISSKLRAIEHWKGRLTIPYNQGRSMQATIKSKISILEMQVTGLKRVLNQSQQTQVNEVEDTQTQETELVVKDTAIEEELIEALEGGEIDFKGLIEDIKADDSAVEVAAEIAAELAPVEGGEAAPSVGKVEGNYEFVRIYVKRLFSKKSNEYARRRGFEDVAAYTAHTVSMIESDPALLNIIAADLATKPGFLAALKLIAKISSL